ncbi:phospholipid-translocating P-type ATPase [Fistulina hepatica ATCC 64428]|nr:phospholipid-translocating P-type ATPase [Fistulina hepatica ATCC 64428]
MSSSRGPAAWFKKISIENLFHRARGPQLPRTVFVNQPLPHSYHHAGRIKHEHVYTSNQIITSKYTLITFLPRNLLEQFRRIANLFFLAIAIMQFFPEFAAISPVVAILPLIIILAVTALKDGYEDLKRHQSDSRVNNNMSRVLAGGHWKNPNAMHGKSKTFIKRILPLRKSGTPDDKLVWQDVPWEDVSVGDFVFLRDGDAIPADVVICSTSEDGNVAYVETKNLDGETNLKSRSAVPALTHLSSLEACADPQNACSVDCDRPELNMYRFNGAVSLSDSSKASVDLSMTLLRGSVVRNTDWVIGLVLFTGVDTKIMLNSGLTPSKRSKIDRLMNIQVIINLLLLAVMSVVCGIADSLLEQQRYPEGALWLYDDDQSGNNPRVNGVITWAYSLLTFQIIIPISLYITLEVVRTLQAGWIFLDDDIKYNKTDQRTLARSWNLADDLGQISYIFSDKTGTLTQNLMVFRRCSISGVVYRGESSPGPYVLDKLRGSSEASLPVPSTSSTPTPTRVSTLPEFRDPYLTTDLAAALSEEEPTPHARLLNGFLSVLALCHTVLAVPTDNESVFVYKAQSPDEAALVQAAADIGYVFEGRERDNLALRTPNAVEHYELLNILEFTTARKRMSVVVRRVGEGEEEKDGKVFIFTKGADSVIFEHLRPGQDELIQTTTEHLNEFANEGLRTLTLAYKIISEDEYEDWRVRYEEATLAMDDRDAKMEAACEELEHNLRLLGATAVEDRLQDEVPETIADLKSGGIKIWVATGDKLETAVAIGRSTNLIAEDSNVIIVRGNNPSGRPVNEQMLRALRDFFPESVNGEELEKVDDNALRRIETGVSSLVGGRDNGTRAGGFVLVIDGDALHHAFDEANHKETLLKLAMKCEGVVCCRVSPRQKAQIVRLVKEGLGSMTLAIGDGANDVSMIQAADVGVGISGEEGMQAVNSSDYAIAQFRFLKKLLLVHGHWSYSRIGKMILTFFYKNIVAVGVLWWFQIYSAWSGYYVFDYTYVLFYNSIWTVLTCPAVGLSDRDLMDCPQLYRFGREQTWFNTKQFLIYMMDGVYQSVPIFFFILYAYWTNSARSDGYNVAQYEFSTTMILSTVLIANVFVAFSAAAWTWWLVFGTSVGTVIIWVYTAIYCSITPSGGSAALLYGNDYYVFRSAIFWLSLPLTFCLSLAPRYLARAWCTLFNPDDLTLVRIIRKRDPRRSLKCQPIADAESANSGEINLALLKRASRTSHLSMPSSMPSRPPTRTASRTDMSTGLVSVDRGFDFAAEENGPAMRRRQTDLSEKTKHGGSFRRRFGSGRWKGAGSSTTGHHHLHLHGPSRLRNLLGKKTTENSDSS